MTGVPNNIVAAFFETAARLAGHPCLHYKYAGAWRVLSWEDVAHTVKAIAAGFLSMGLRFGDKVAILADTCIEWTLADCAIMAAGGVTVPIYHTLTTPRISQMLRDCRPQMAVIGDEGLGRVFRQARKLGGWQHEIPLITMDKGADGCLLAGLAGRADQGGTQAVERIVAGLSPSDIATCVYTSGTTGDMKGVALTHRNILSEINAVQEVFDFSPRDVGLACLPLAHVLGRLMQFYQLKQGCQLAYAEGIAQLANNYREVRPHFVVGVPRMLEKVHEMARLHIGRSKRLTRWFFNWAISVGERRSRSIQRHKAIPLRTAVCYFPADLLVFRRFRARLGGRLTTFICGGAALSPDVAEFFHAAGILVLEGYGLTETFAAATVNRPGDFRFGTVGRPISGVEVKLAPDKEVLIRGPTVFEEYLNKPDETREAFDEAGWFRTGDLGEFTRDGFLRLTGRKKEIIVTAGGKNIAPQAVESLMAESPYINHVMVYGEGRRYLTALLTLNAAAVAAYLRQQGLDANEKDLVNHPAVRPLIAGHIDRQNGRLSPFETVKRFAIVDGDFSVQGGELTPTLKIRRDIVEKKYREVLENMYR